MREIRFIAVHCTATRPDATVEAIERYWREENKWKSPGYHYIVKADGETRALLGEDKASNGVRDFNSVSVNVAYIGGVDRYGKPFDTRTGAQKKSLLKLLKELKGRYPGAVIQGHRDFPGVTKACPSFDAMKEYKHL